MIGAHSMGRASRPGQEKKEALVNVHETVSMYTEPPEIEITLDELELYALDRLMVLRKIAELKARGVKPMTDMFKTELAAAINKYMPIKRSASANEAGMRKDNVSHFILRLAFCRTEELRRQFLSEESALFRHRLEGIGNKGLADFIATQGLDFSRVSEEDKNALRTKLLALPNAPVQAFSATTYYKIPFTQAVDLIGSRQVYLEGGFAFVPLHRVISIVASRFRMGLSRSLITASNGYPIVASDDRFGPLLHNMNKQYIGKDFAGSADDAEALRPDQLDLMAERSMPLCMKQLHGGLRSQHRLKHWGRLQYGLFLKGAGLSMEDARLFFQTEFSKVLGADQFDKKYAYGIRHMYGQEGKRTNYTPYSCMKIIMGNPPGPGHHHGCPYRHYDANHLSGVMNGLKLNVKDKEQVMNQAKGKNYQLACQAHFEATHKGWNELGVSPDGVGNHPNAWMAASRDYYARKAEKAAESDPSPGQGRLQLQGSTNSGGRPQQSQQQGKGLTVAPAAGGGDTSIGPMA